MTLALAGALLLLALVDSTSFGTLVLPLLLLLRPRVQHRQMGVYLGTIAVFYLGVGLILLLAGEAVRARWGQLAEALESTPAYAMQVAVGAALVLVSYAIDPAYSHRFTWLRRRRRTAEGLGTRGRWRDRLLGERASLGATAGVALAAGLVEVASMLPYLAAVGMITAAGLPRAGSVSVLAGYVLVMMLPALVLWGLRTGLGPRVEERLRRLASWLEARSGSALAWTVGIVGVVLLINGLPVLIDRLG